MGRNIFCVLCLAISTIGIAEGQTRLVKRFIAKKIGTQGYLKAPVIRIEHGNPFLGAEDATNVVDGHVRYKARLPGAGLFENDAESTNALQFRQQAESTIKNRDNKDDRSSTVRFFDRGTPFMIHKTHFKKKGKEIWTDVTFSSGTKSRIRFYFDDATYTTGEVRTQLEVIISPRPLDAVAKIVEGMSTKEVVSIKGKPKSEISIGSKTVLTYDDVKLIFRNDKLVDVE